MTSDALLFTAPSDFLRLEDWTEQPFHMTFREAWTTESLPEDAGFRYWVPNPGQHFVIDGGVLDRYPQLAAIATPSTGVNHIDASACEAREIAVYSLLDDRENLEKISASAEFTFLHVLNALRRIDVGLNAVRRGGWRDDETRFRGRELAGRRVGLVGCGRIGRRLARFFRAFECEVTAYDPYVALPDGVRGVPTIEALFDESQLLLVCCSLTEETRGMVGASLVRRLPVGAVLVNTSRGEVLQEGEIVELLGERPDLRIGADVVTGEVDGTYESSPLVRASRQGQVLVTPHIAGATVESQQRAALITLNLLADRALRDRRKGAAGARTE